MCKRARELRQLSERHAIDPQYLPVLQLMLWKPRSDLVESALSQLLIIVRIGIEQRGREQVTM
jgi:hypothetical protein